MWTCGILKKLLKVCQQKTENVIYFHFDFNFLNDFYKYATLGRFYDLLSIINFNFRNFFKKNKF